MPELRDPKAVSESLPQSPPPILGCGDNTKPFSIREYVLASRQKDIFQNWPFQVEYLNEFLDHGIRNVLPPFEPLTSRYEKTSEETVSKICSTTAQIRLKSSERKCKDNLNKGNEDEKLLTQSQNPHHHRDHHYLLRKRKLMSKALERVDDDEVHSNCVSELTEEKNDDDRHLKNCEGTAAIKVFTRRKVVLKFEFKGRDSMNSRTRVLNWKGSTGLRLE